ncbi:hypothetical protein [Hydrogenophaga pseudoflava]|uniref:hypothetical protein n=1 Tax=Hydrogenophaga pseudoflava TaxID=47421 RepID=UPI0027E4373C|nr:hypothetical protein [Hydrogenophaga pseudoflava]MDQ7747109.1 hypothetical protein [Hydrogenophaga pseudoflava]
MKALPTRRANALVLALWCALLLTPLLVHLFRPPHEAPLENRTLAPAPGWPRTPAEGSTLPVRTQAWMRDHFGLRGELLEASHRWRHRLFGDFLSADLVPGQAGEVFYNVFGDTAGSSLRVMCGAERIKLPVVGQRVADLLAATRAELPRSYLMIAPDKSRLRPRLLPRWLQVECASGQPPAESLVGRLAQQPEIADRLFYPIDAMRQVDGVDPVYRPWNLHWDFHGAAVAADWLAQGQWGMPRRYEVALEPRETAFDLQGLAPGVEHRDTTLVPVYPDGQVLVCHNDPACFPEFAAEAALLFQVARVRSAWQLPAGQRRPTLVIIGDSFGDNITEPLARYFAEVWYLSMNHLSRLSPEQRRHVRSVVIDQFRPDVLLHVYNEGTVLVDQARYLGLARALLEPVPTQ